MDSKLTLKLDKTVIEKAKKFASSQKRSLSGLIESYLKLLTFQVDIKNSEEITISSFVKSMSTGVHLPADLDLKSDYFVHLTDKHK
jgi:hypothetical protein